MAFDRPRGRSSYSGGGANRQGSYRSDDFGPPAEILAVGEYMHPCEGEMVCKATIDKVPYFNAPVFLENKSMIGKVDEILGPINGYCFTIKPSEGILATSFKPTQKIFIGTDKLLPLERFLPKPKSATPSIGSKRKAPGAGGSARGGAARGRGGGSGFRGGSGGFRGGSRGGSRGFSSRGSQGGSRGGSRGGSGSFRGSSRGRY